MVRHSFLHVKRDLRIDNVTSVFPVWICRLDGHMCLANALAMSIANITASTPDVEGGEVVRFENGEPTGIFKDNAMMYIENVVPLPSIEEEDKAVDTALLYLLSNGVTSVHHMGSWNDLAVFERARDSNRLKLRVYDAVPLSTWNALKEKIDKTGRGDEWLKIGNLKAFVDGSLGSHTALMFDPYSDTNSSG